MLISSEVKALILFSSPFAYSEVFSLVLSLFLSSLGLHVLIHTWLTEQYWPFLGPSCFSRVCHRIGISAHMSIGQKHSQLLSGIWSTHCRLKCFSRFRFLLIQFNLAAFYLLVLGFFCLLFSSGSCEELALHCWRICKRSCWNFFCSLFASCCNFLIQSSRSYFENKKHSVTI